MSKSSPDASEGYLGVVAVWRPSHVGGTTAVTVHWTCPRNVTSLILDSQIRPKPSCSSARVALFQQTHFSCHHYWFPWCTGQGGQAILPPHPQPPAQVPYNQPSHTRHRHLHTPAYG